MVITGGKSIGKYAFYDCTSLTSIEIPSSVTSIGSSAFYNCSKLTDVYYVGTREQWNGVTIGANNSSLTNVTIHFVPCRYIDHDEIAHDAKAPTCTEIGWDAYVTCSRCDYTTYVKKAKLGHDEIAHDAKAPTCTEIGWDAYVTCSRCDYTTYQAKPSLGHTSSAATQENRTEPDCVTNGSYDRVVYCSVCDTEISRKEVIVPALGHDEIKHDAKTPTCTEIGWDAYVTCSRCDYTTYVEKAKLGHDEIAHDAKAPTCTEIGWDAYVTCSRCDYTTYVEKAKLGHDEVAHAAQAPTCTEIGWDAYVTCSRCDYTTYKAKAALGHSPADAVEENRVEPSCVVSGSYDRIVYCSVCEAKLSHRNINIPALGHDEIKHDAKAPTYTEIGWEAYVTCSRCDYSTYQEIPALRHTPASAVIENRVEPDCVTDGSYDSVVYCSVCKEELSRETVVLDKLGHDEIPHDAKAPTCIEIGWEAYVTCSRCDYTTYNELSALGHDEIAHDAKAPDCTVISWDAYVTCSRCDYTTYAEKKALGHDGISHEAKAPTCTEIGWDAYVTCSRCDYTTYVEKAALGHDEIANEAKTPTCTEIGWDAYVTCSRCDYTTYEEKAKLGHDEIAHEGKAPTFDAAGWEAYVTCSRCDYTTYKVLPALKHTPASAVVENRTEPDCVTNGSYDSVVYCSVCEEELSRQTITIDKLGHDEIAHDAKAPTCTEIGWDAYVTCSRCDYTTYSEKTGGGHDYVAEEGAPGMIYTCSRCEDSYVEPIPSTPVALKTESFETAWGMTFESRVLAGEAITAGTRFRFFYDGEIAALLSHTASDKLTVWEEDGVITLKANADIAAEEELLTLTLETSLYLTAGEHALLTTDGEGSEFAPLVIYEMGDVNLDGKVNARDVTMIKQYVVKMVELSDVQKIYANVYVDTDKDGAPLINSRDSLLIQQFIVKMDVTLGDRVEITFSYEDAPAEALPEATEPTEKRYSVKAESGFDSAPALADGYVWSADKVTLVLPDFSAILEDKTYYVMKKEGQPV